MGLRTLCARNAQLARKEANSPRNCLMPRQYFQIDVDKLEQMRILRGWAHADLATKARCSTRTLDGIILKRRQCVISTLRKLASAFDVTPPDLVLKTNDEPTLKAPDDLITPQKKRSAASHRYLVKLVIMLLFETFDETQDLIRIIDLLERLDSKNGNDFDPLDTTDGSTTIWFDCTYYEMELLKKLDPQVSPNLRQSLIDAQFAVMNTISAVESVLSTAAATTFARSGHDVLFDISDLVGLLGQIVSVTATEYDPEETSALNELQRLTS